MLAIALALTTLAAAPAPDPNLVKAQAEIAALHYDKAEAALDATLAAPKPPLETRLSALQLQGEVKAFVNKPDDSTKAFEQLLYLNPKAAPDPSWSPKVGDRFKDAQAWLAKGGPLGAEPDAPLAEGGKVKAVVLSVHDEPLHLAKSVRVTAGGKSDTLPVPADGKVVAPVAPAPEVPWSAEVLDANEGVLATAGSPAAPLVARAPAPIAAVETSTSPKMNLRTAAYVAGGVGGACLIGSAIFAGMASSDRGTLRDAQKDSAGRITSLSQQQYTDTYNRSNSRATTAVVLGGVGVAALATGVALWFYGKPVGVAPTGNGAAVVGSLP